jgi:hypothetical protein
MNSEILSKYTFWYTLPLLLFSAFLAWYLYRKDDKFSTLERWKLYVMMASRFFSIFIIGFFLLSIVIRYIRIKIEQPIILLAQDNSESIKFAYKNPAGKSAYIGRFNDFKDKLAENYTVKTISFGEKITDTISYAYAEKETDFSKLFRNLEKKYVNYNIGALIIASDGIYNQGVSPLYAAKGLTYPVYTIALGDSSRKKDVFISKLLTNPMAFLGDEFPVEIQLGAYGFKGSKLNLRITNAGKIVQEEKIDVRSEDFFTKLHFNIAARKKGLQHYRIELSYLNGEYTKANNSRIFAIDVIDDKRKVLILANSVHPDITAMREALKVNKNLLVDFYTADNFNKKIEDYQLVIFHQLPAGRHNLRNLFLKLTKAKIPALFILGAQTNIPELNSLNIGFKITKNQNATELSTVTVNKSFNLFETKAIQIADFSDFPPLVSPFGNYLLGEKADILMYQKIKGIKTEKPLIFIFPGDNSLAGKYGFICGEGIWRWRMADYLENENHQQFDALIDRIVHYLSLDIKKERFIVQAKRIFNENEQINIRADYYNKSYELSNKADVSMEITNSEGHSFRYIFSKTNGAYDLNAGQWPVGKYSFKAQITESGKTFTKKGSFIVVPLNIEAVNLQANYKLLYQIAKESGASMFLPDSLDALFYDLQQNPNVKAVSFSTKDLIDLIELKWLFFIIISLLSAEWFLRKFFGGY